MADVKPFVIICFILADIIAKVPVADLIANFMADVIAIMVWLMFLPLVILRYVNIIACNVIALAITSAIKLAIRSATGTLAITSANIKQIITNGLTFAIK